ncbi:hypothetical protein [Streptomyces sp. V2I9]|uniref:hypothetical protein n=1 Tax=unclassified Streptomyces TaxID=2593676 RepID=UPI0027871280|nr:hypothetical protein [Streptomyces sp. V2I9]MDQ0985677.1 hypothetical protein [Streptomyces sp. V2I9]
MAPGQPASWSSRCAVYLLAAAGAALGPLGGSAHGSPPPDGPPLTASAPEASRPAASAAPPASGASRPARTSSGSPAAHPSGLPLPDLPLPSGVPFAGSPGERPVPSSTASGHGAPGVDAPGTSPSPSASPEVSGSTAPLAGREAGAGKARPGRSLPPWEPAAAEPPVGEEQSGESRVDPVDLPVSTPPPDAFTDPAQRAAARALDAASLRRVQQVSLGTGIALVGMGIGFLAFRLRRAN